MKGLFVGIVLIGCLIADCCFGQCANGVCAVQSQPQQVVVDLGASGAYGASCAGSAAAYGGPAYRTGLRGRAFRLRGRQPVRRALGRIFGRCN